MPDVLITALVSIINNAQVTWLIKSSLENIQFGQEGNICKMYGKFTCVVKGAGWGRMRILNS